jgi:hypothetical protein
MSDINSEIARLTGRLIWSVDNGPLHQFEEMLKRVQRQMVQMAKQADQLSAKLNQKLGIQDNSKARQQMSRDTQAAQIREQRALAATNKAAREVMKTDLMQRKLSLADSKAEQFIISDSLRQKQLAAVAQAKEYKAQAEKLKLSGIQAKQDQSLAASKARMAVQEERLTQAKARSAIAAHKELQALTGTQRVQLALNEARERAQRTAAKFTAGQAAAQARMQRQTERHEQGKSRFAWAESRQNAWAARQEERLQPQGMSLGGAMLGLGVIGTGIAGLTVAVDALAARIEKRQESTADTQLFDNQLLAAGNNDEERKKIRAAFISNSQEYGMDINRASATQYGNQVQGFRAQGKSLDEAIALQKTQAQVFRIGALNQQEQYSAALQLGQGYGKDRFTGGDLRPLTDALGGRLTTILYQAIGKALKYKGNPDQLPGFVLQAQHDGLVNGKMVQQGLRDIVAQSPELLERHAHSLDAQQVRVENSKYLQTDEIQQSPELIEALGERLTAERQLIEASRGLNTTLMNLDVGLTKFQTGLLNMLAGKNSDNSIKTAAQRADSIGAPSIIEGAGINPVDLNGAANISDKPVADPLDAFYRRLFGIKDSSRGEADGLKVSTPSFDGAFELPKIDVSKFNPPPAENILGVLHRFRPDAFLDAASAMRQVQTPTPAYPAPEQSIVTTNSNNTTNVSPASITVNITAPAALDSPEAERAIGKAFEDALRKSYNEIIFPQETE